MSYSKDRYIKSIKSHIWGLHSVNIAKKLNLYSYSGKMLIPWENYGKRT